MERGEKMEETYYCPDCSSPLERLYSCGSESYFCNACNKLVSRKSMVSEEELRSKVEKLVIKKLDEGK